MKIGLYLYRPFETGGTEKTILERAKIFKNAGHEVTFIFGQEGKNINMLEKWAEIGNVVKQDYVKETFDLVIYDSIYNNELILSKEYMQVINANMIDSKDNLENKILIDKYVVVSKECQQQFYEKYQQESTIIPNIINSEIKELAKEKYEIPKKKYNFVVVSRIDPQKGFERLATFIQKLHNKTEDYQIVVVGGNDNYPKYVQELKNRLSKYNIIWEGLQNNPYKYIKNADYLVQLSDYESQCMAMYESLILRNTCYSYRF